MQSDGEIMNALVIGGTHGFGADVARCLDSHGLNIITVGREEPQFASSANYICDVGDLTAWSEVISLIEREHPRIDVLLFVVGHARAASAVERTASDWTLHMHRNLTYVAMAFPHFARLLKRSSFARVATIGSQWSYRSDCEDLLPYITAKQALRALTRELAVEHVGIHLNHYCPPTMDTPGYHAVAQSFREIGRESVVATFAKDGLASSRTVAEALCQDVLRRRTSAKTLQIRPDGTVKLVND